ncbi:acyl carrier protein [Tabrizicola oligotrophica]|uniref:Acyl carrier protein n=1 Tax=Tabrizicola oligotrophica TaxID=2710650 RepID=A0A6M0QNB5_9RHOB|nr:phosphopantetheine-binding protein [Tabrizicola oligotrophica]NEY88968.1 acyl carrier protein [Tabrizicola oligotrophica]
MDGALGFEVSVADRVRAIIAEQAMLEPHDVTPGAALSDLGLDSLMLVETLFALEEAFDISVPFNANDPAAGRFDLSTVRAVIAGVEGLIAAR